MRGEKIQNRDVNKFSYFKMYCNEAIAYLNSVFSFDILCVSVGV